MKKKWFCVRIRPGLIMFLVVMLQTSWGGSQGVMEKGKGSVIQKEQAQGKQSIHKLFGALKRGDENAVTELKNIFDQSTNKEEKQQIASSLLEAKVGDEKHINLLIKYVKQVIESDIPFPPREFDEKGNAKFTAAFLAWCDEHGVEPNETVKLLAFTFPIDVIRLADANDPRAFDTLLAALDSSNNIIAMNAARGLARLRDKRAIQPLIKKLKQFPPDAVALHILVLLYFDDPEAQAGAEELMQDKEKLRQIRKEIEEHGYVLFLGFE